MHSVRFRCAIVLLAAVLSAACASVSGPGPGSGRVHHVVICWLKEPGDLAARERLVAASRALGAIPGVVAVRTGQVLPSERPVVDDSFDVAVVFTLADERALKAYLEHPDHLRAAAEVLRPLTRKVVVYDFVE